MSDLSPAPQPEPIAGLSAPATAVAVPATAPLATHPEPVLYTVPDLRTIRNLYPEKPIVVADNAAFAINPVTGRLIRKGGDRYRQLVRAGRIIDPEMLATTLAPRLGRPPPRKKLETMIEAALNRRLPPPPAVAMPDPRFEPRLREPSPSRELSPPRRVSTPIAVPVPQRSALSRLDNISASRPYGPPPGGNIPVTSPDESPWAEARRAVRPIAEDEPMAASGVPRLRARSQPRTQPAPERGSLLAREAASFHGLASRMVEASRAELDEMSEEKARASLRARFAALLAL